MARPSNINPGDRAGDWIAMDRAPRPEKSTMPRGVIAYNMKTEEVRTFSFQQWTHMSAAHLYIVVNLDINTVTYCETGIEKTAKELAPAQDRCLVIHQTNGEPPAIIFRRGV